MTDQRPNDDAGRVSVIQTDADQGSRKAIYDNSIGDWHEIDLGGKYVLRLKYPVTDERFDELAARVKDFLDSPDKPVIMISTPIEIVRIDE
jgi:hypothetical protein